MKTNETALLIIDMQYESNFGIEGVDEAIANAKSAIETAREFDIPVIYTRQVNRYDNIGTSLYEPTDENGKPIFYTSDKKNVEIFKEIYPKDDEIVIDKYRWSAFHETSLDLFLKDIGVKNIIIGGFVTDGCVMTSAFDAFFNNYKVTLVKDMCKTTNEGAQMSSILIMCNWIYGLEVINTSEVVKKIKGEKYRAWNWRKPDEIKFSPESLAQHYKDLT
ncbi:isochorismatase family cysteine hydrolase [Natranaerobius trueperi]|uniref:Isochorismatase n=1 Tax=Natranaerobius trueperi TaxID=759412 RepID=A0A226C0Y7_9FIRM|nr:isochorismatase family cysteine hydrolase [Natranaerobius trueperi]OWZ84923.1 isochorismatase [Natranaerobius trueperi]